MSARAVLFDLDGLLVDSEPVWKRAEETVLARHGRAFSYEVAVTHMGMRLPEGVAVMLDAYDLRHLDAHAFERELVDEFLDGLARGFAKRPGADAAIDLAQARGPVAVASSSPRRVIDRALALGGWTGRFALLGSGEEVARGKPAPDLFLLVARRLGFAPGACTVIEDSRHGVAAARAAGMRCIAVPGPEFDRRAFEGAADVVLGSLEELAPVHLD